MSRLEPVTPGEILLEEYLVPLSLSQNQLARDLDIPAGRINEIIRGKRSITADTALRLSIYFGTTPEFWLGLQADFELRIARQKALDSIKLKVHSYKEMHAH